MGLFLPRGNYKKVAAGLGGRPAAHESGRGTGRGGDVTRLV